ncbi:hypothetical protein E2562_021349 [Oryza meyeriana var. granulata]|uniref:Retrotransposon gag domain-containing protein n=1 Tax=Oryza meyeriana var. granulata TaxID=110450 RepID=A0A6G1CHN2_9ORYZ|nr:hypothetical protein E2562_021349 [Oryza meyeriana var. granulata]
MVANNESIGVTMAQNLNHGQSKLADFQRTHSLNFSSATDPLDTDDWLRDIEAKLNLACYDEREKAAYAVHYLQGTTAAWWESYKTLIPANEPITWAVFKEGFRSTHIPDGLMELKRKEFLNLKQRDMPFMDFLNCFNYLARGLCIVPLHLNLQEFSQGLNTQHHVRNNRRFNDITAAVIKLAHKVGQ